MISEHYSSEGQHSNGYNSSSFIDECISKNVFQNADSNTLDTTRKLINSITTTMTTVFFY